MQCDSSNCTRDAVYILNVRPIGIVVVACDGSSRDYEIGCFDAYVIGAIE